MSDETPAEETIDQKLDRLVEEAARLLGRPIKAGTDYSSAWSLDVQGAMPMDGGHALARFIFDRSFEFPSWYTQMSWTEEVWRTPEGGGRVALVETRRKVIQDDEVRRMAARNFQRFEIHRASDGTGVSGVGHVADGVRFPDGTCAVRWRGDVPSTVVWRDLEDVVRVHGHGGTRFLWIDL